MKKLISAFAILGVIGTAGLMSGCGGSDHDDDNPPPVVQGFAPASVANQSVTLTENGQSRDIQFALNGDTFTQFENGTTNAVGTGTFNYVQQGPNNGQLVLTVTDNTGANSVTYVLTFNSATAGTYSFSSTSGQTGSGTFSNLQTIVPSGGGNNGGGDGGGNNGGGNNGGGTGEIPTALTGRLSTSALKVRGTKDSRSPVRILSLPTWSAAEVPTPTRQGPAAHPRRWW